VSDRSLFNAFIYLEPVQRSEDGCDMRKDLGAVTTVHARQF